MNETWLPIPSYFGYEVSDHGRVRSYHRPGRHAGLRKEPKLLKLPAKEAGYRFVRLYREDGTSVCVYVHTLVLITFHGPRPEGKEGRHHDNDPSNNREDNLSWSTHEENLQDQVRYGTTTAGRRRTILTSVQVLDMRLRAAAGQRQAELAEMFGITVRSVNRIVNRHVWKHVSEITA